MKHIANDNSQSHKKKVHLNNTQEILQSIHKRKRKHHDWSHFASPIWDDFPSNTNICWKLFCPNLTLNDLHLPGVGSCAGFFLPLSSNFKIFEGRLPGVADVPGLFWVFLFVSFKLQWKSLNIPRMPAKGTRIIFRGWRIFGSSAVWKQVWGVGGQGSAQDVLQHQSMAASDPGRLARIQLNGNHWDLALSDQGRFPLSANVKWSKL